MTRHVLIIVPELRFFLSHRLNIALAARAAGWRVTVAAPDALADPRMDAAGIAFAPIALPRGARNPLGELAAIRGLHSLMRALRPDLVHLVTAKPMLYGGIAARLLRIPVVAAVTGLGFVFIQNSLKARAIRTLLITGYRTVLGRRGNHILFQNPDDAELFTRLGIVGAAQVTLIPGSGVDLDAIPATPLPEGPPVALLPARLLHDKGVMEFVEAARILRAQGSDAVFRLLGDPDPGNPAALSRAELDAIVAEGIVEWHPHTADIAGALAQSHLVVLPSYREGFPKSLVDAAAAGRASATSDVTGCRDAIIIGQTGQLFALRDAVDTARVMGAMLADRPGLIRMGAAARALAEARYDARAIAAQHLNIYEHIHAEALPHSIPSP